MFTVRNEKAASNREVSLQITLGLSLGRPSGEDSPFLMAVPAVRGSGRLTHEGQCRAWRGSVVGGDKATIGPGSLVI